MVALLATLLASSSVGAAPFVTGPDHSLDVHVLMQLHGRFAQGEASDGQSWSKDIFLRRVRLLLTGTMFRRFSFFVDTEQPNWGRGGNWAVAPFLSDAFGSIMIADALVVDVGMMLLPISRHGYSSAASLNALDFHLGMLRYVPGSHKNLRDAGIQLRGRVAGGRFTYRAGVFNGSQGHALQADASGAAIQDRQGRAVLASNPRDWPRFAGHVRWAFLGQEKGYFANGMTFSDRPTVSVGAGFEYLHDAVMDRPAELARDGSVARPGRLRGAWSVAADVYADVPFGAGADHEFVAMAAFLMNDHGRELAWAREGTAQAVPAASSGLGVMAELGYRWRFIGPALSVDWFRGQRDGNDLLAVRGGLAYWLRGHSINVKAEFSAERRGRVEAGPWFKAFTTQVQVFL